MGIKLKNVDRRSSLVRFDAQFYVTAIALQYYTCPVAAKIEKLSIGANAAGSTAATVTVTRMIDGTVCASGTFTSGTIGTVIEATNTLSVAITAGSLLSVNTSSTTTMEYTVGLHFVTDQKQTA